MVLSNKTKVYLAIYALCAMLLMGRMALSSFEMLSSDPIRLAPEEATKLEALQNDHPTHQTGGAPQLTQQLVTVNMSLAHDCLQQTTPNMTLTYPRDAWGHYREIHRAMYNWSQHHPSHRIHRAASFKGPWIENHWINYFEAKLENSNELSDVFGPFIPILIPWTDRWVKGPPKSNYPKAMVEALLQVLRPDVAYITLCQNADGLPGRMKELHMSKIPNILVLSAGGYGHVPIPLLKQPEYPIENTISMTNRSYLLSYVGSITKSPQKLRPRLDMYLNRLLNNVTTKANAAAITSDASEKIAKKYRYYKGNDWRTIMVQSKFSLAPRGFGRTSYHVVECLHMGLIPIQVYVDIPWIPYRDLFPKLGYHVKIGLPEMEQLVKDLLAMPDSEIQKREDLIRHYRKSHFEVPGIMDQIQNFMLYGEAKSDLRCEPLPSSPRGDR